MWLKHVNWNAQRWLCPRSLLEVGFKVRATYTCIGLYIHVHSPGLKVNEVAHDMQLAVGRYVKQDLKLLNSFDTWHGMKLAAIMFNLCLHLCDYIHRIGTKNVAKELAKITKG